MALTEEQLQHFYREGYVVVPGLLPQATIDAVLAAPPKSSARAAAGAHRPMTTRTRRRRRAFTGS